MPPVLNKLFDIAIAVALTAGVVFVIVGLNALLMAPRGSWTGLKIWYAFIARPDILGTMMLTALVTTAYYMWQGRRSR